MGTYKITPYHAKCVMGTTLLTNCDKSGTRSQKSMNGIIVFNNMQTNLKSDPQNPIVSKHLLTDKMELYLVIKLELVTKLSISWCHIWEKVFKNGQSKICGRQPLKKTIPFWNGFKGCLPQILLGPLLNILSHSYSSHYYYQRRIQNSVA